MRGGLDDALEKLARRDELRRRATGEATGTPPAVTELVEAVAAVVAHHPELGVSVGVEGAGDPMLLHFYFDDGQVQVNADAVPAEPVSPAPRHADFEVEAEEPANEDVTERFPASRYAASAEDRYHGDEADTAERRYGSFDNPPPPDVGESSRDLGARMRDLGMATTREPVGHPAHPFAATPPPPVPPQTTPNRPMSAQPMSGRPASGRSASPAHAMPPQPRPPVPPQPGPAHAEYDRPDYDATRRIRPEHYQAPAEPAATERIPHQPPAPEQRTGMPTPLPHPIPLKVERPEETEMAARRLAALLRDDPTLLSQPPD